MWNNLDISTKSLGLLEFKEKLKEKLKPTRIKHHCYGSKIGNILLSRIRLDRSDLNLHKFTIGKVDSPQCDCFAKKESSLHYLVDCFLYSNERQTLYSHVEHFIPNFKTFNKNRKYEILVFGLHPENNDYCYTNKSISYAVQTYILKTKRFSEKLK